MHSNSLSTKQLEFLIMIVRLHNDLYCSYKCSNITVVERVIYTKKYDVFQKTVLNIIRKQYVEYLRS